MYYIYSVYNQRSGDNQIIMIKHPELKDYDDDIFFDQEDIIQDTGWELSMHNQETEFAIYPDIEASWTFSFEDIETAYKCIIMIVFEDQDNVMEKLY